MLIAGLTCRLCPFFLCRLVRPHGGSKKRLECAFVDHIPFADVDRPHRVAIEPVVEHFGRIVERRTLGKSDNASPVQTKPSCSQMGTPAGLDGLRTSFAPRLRGKVRLEMLHQSRFVRRDRPAQQQERANDGQVRLFAANLHSAITVGLPIREGL